MLYVTDAFNSMSFQFVPFSTVFIVTFFMFVIFYSSVWVCFKYVSMIHIAFSVCSAQLTNINCGDDDSVTVSWRCHSNTSTSLFSTVIVWISAVQWRINICQGDHGERAECQPKWGSVAEPPAVSRGRAPRQVSWGGAKAGSFLSIFIQKVGKSSGLNENLPQGLTQTALCSYDHVDQPYILANGGAPGPPIAGSATANVLE